MDRDIFMYGASIDGSEILDSTQSESTIIIVSKNATPQEFII